GGALIVFFQAEDGIRGYKVTGVQTCALPIFLVADDRGDQRRLAAVLTGNAADRADHAVEARVHLLKPQPGRSAKDDTDQPAGVEIGRASCRERVWSSVGGG